MHSVKLAMLVGTVGLLSSCSSTVSIPDPPMKPLAGVGGAPSSCPVIGSRKWSATLTRSGGPASKLTLRVDGEIDLPTPGFTPIWRIGISDRANPPGLQLVVAFDPPKDQMVPQVVTINPVHFTGEVAYPRYRYILIRCGDAALARIAEVQVQP
jgi:hypothetical protein